MGDGVMAGHFRFDKRFQGDLDASSVVHMLAVGTDVPGSAAYVAIERLSGTLHGRSGTFFLQHNGVMNRGAAVAVADDRAGFGYRRLGRHRRAAWRSTSRDGKHFYTLDYSPGSKARSG